MSDFQKTIADDLINRGYEFKDLVEIEPPRENIFLVEKISPSRHVFITEVNSHVDYRCIEVYSKFYKLI